ncbi:hypothetical protein, conserved, partial [Babesia bigemina]
VSARPRIADTGGCARRGRGARQTDKAYHRKHCATPRRSCHPLTLLHYSALAAIPPVPRLPSPQSGHPARRRHAPEPGTTGGCGPG